MKAEEIKQYRAELNEELRAMEVKGEVCLYGGAVMCLVFDARPATKDVDAVFRPAQGLILMPLIEAKLGELQIPPL